MVGIENVIDLDDPSGLKNVSNARAVEMVGDLEMSVRRILIQVNPGDDPATIQAIVSKEMSNYNQATRDTVLAYVNDTRIRSVRWADNALNILGINTIGSTGMLGGGVDYRVLQALSANVVNDIDSLSADTKQRVSQILIDGLAQGQGARELTKDLSDELDMPRARAQTIARTETMKAFNDVSQSQYRRYGIEKVQWLTANDERLCEECAAHDGQQYDIDDAPEIPAHPNCRCVLIPVKEDAG